MGSAKITMELHPRWTSPAASLKIHLKVKIYYLGGVDNESLRKLKENDDG